MPAGCSRRWHIDAIRVGRIAALWTNDGKSIPHGDAASLGDFDIRPKSALWFGNQHDGLRDQVVQEADECLRIPSYGFAESFNISVAAAVVLHHVTEKLREADVAWRLRPEVRGRLKAEWIRKVVRKEFHRDEGFWEHPLRERV